MPSVVDDLNELLVRERGEVEALKSLVHHLSGTDPDIAGGAGDLMESASWSCSGLYHRINHLHGVPTLDSADLATRVVDERDTKHKLEMVCMFQKKDMQMVRALLKRDDLDGDTRSFLQDMLNTHESSARWCESTLDEWKRDI